MPASTGLKEGWVQGLCASGTELYAGILGEGVWRLPLSEITSSVKSGPDVKPAICTLGHNYPNPFNPSTTIHYELATGSRVTLKVYNVLGQEVATLVDQEKPAGVYDVQFDGRHLSSGTYVYRLQSHKYSASKRMLLLK